MPVSVLTEEDIKFIKANRLKMSGKEMSRHLGHSAGVAGRWLKKNGLTVPDEIVSKFKCQAQFKKFDPKCPDNIFIKENYLTIPVKRMATLLKRSQSYILGRMRRMNLTVPADIVEQRKTSNQFKPGDVPFTKGKKPEEYMSEKGLEINKANRFQSGSVPKNTLYDGAIRTRSSKKTGYTRKYIRISQGVWKELNIYNWEKENGPVPKGHILACQDGDPLNCEPSNWKLMTKAENAIRNSGSVNLSDGFVAQMLAGRDNQDIKQEILKDPGLLEIKRQSIYLKRTIKKVS